MGQLLDKHTPVATNSPARPVKKAPPKRLDYSTLAEAVEKIEAKQNYLQQEGDIPQIFLGTASLKDPAPITSAINLGYRGIDTALLYGNQVPVGEAIRTSSVPRSEIWVTSKVSFFPANSAGVWMYNANNLKGEETSSIDLCLQQLGLDQVDLMLIHNPCATVPEYNTSTLPHFFELFNQSGYASAIKPEKLADGTPLRPLIIEAKRNEVKKIFESDAATHQKAFEARRDAWRALEKAHKEGKCRYIGVSNYPAELLLEMKEYAEIFPAVNELELHPRFSSPRLRQVAKDLGIVLLGYGTGAYVSFSSADSPLHKIAQKIGKTPNEVALRWTTQHGVVVLPRSGSAGHQAENLKVNDFTLSDEDMAALDALNEDYPYYWDPVPTMWTVKPSQ